jgi:hypothetical protein
MRGHETEGIIEQGAGKQPEEDGIADAQRQGRQMDVWGSA